MDDVVTVEAIDFSRSFLWWRIDTDMVPPGTITVPPPYALNNARVPLDCLCTITAPGGLVRRRFALGTSCKTEAGGAERRGQQGLRRRHGGDRAGGADLAMPSSSRSMPGWISPSCK